MRGPTSLVRVLLTVGAGALVGALAGACEDDDRAPSDTVLGPEDDGGGTMTIPPTSSDAAVSDDGDASMGDGGGGEDAADVDGGEPFDASAPDASSADGGEDAGEVDAAPPPPVTTTYVTTTFGGKTRGYYLSVPSNYVATKKYPLVMMFHGNPSNATELLGVFPYEQASGQEAIIAYPDAIDGNWDLSTPTDQNRDMRFIQALPAEIASTRSIDGARIYGFGFSGGAFFVNQLACRLSGIFKAVTSHSGGAPFESGNPPKDAQGYLICPGGPMPFLIIHGDADVNVDPGGSAYAARHWAHVDGCQNTRTATTPAPCETYLGCPAGRAVTYCSVPGLTHAPWTGAPATSWQFFKSLP